MSFWGTTNKDIFQSSSLIARVPCSGTSRIIAHDSGEQTPQRSSFLVTGTLVFGLSTLGNTSMKFVLIQTIYGRHSIAI